MNTKLYVGNLPFDAQENQLQEYFESCGAVKEVSLVLDRDTGRPRGFAFVEMEEVSGMENAIRELDGKEFGGRELRINEARPKENRPPRSGGQRSHGPRGGGGYQKGGGGPRGGGNRRGGNREGGGRDGGKGRWR